MSTCVEPQGWVVDLAVPPPSLSDNTGDADRLINALKTKINRESIFLSHKLLKSLPERMRAYNYQFRAVFFISDSGYEVIGLLPSNNKQQAFGLAVDLGTTRIVLHLLNLESGERVKEIAFDNPQTVIGPDILTRIHYTEHEGGLQELQSLVVTSLNEEIRALCYTCNISTTDIFIITLAGNTAMSHLLLELPPRYLIREPYIPVCNRFNTLKSTELGLNINSHGRVFVFPNIGSYFGGDLISGILFSGMHRAGETTIIVDVGTNAEVVLGNESWLVACAGAAGPALEGGVSSIGMTARPGVIEKIKIDPTGRRIEYETIGNKPPLGICGSGMIDLAAQLFLTGMIDLKGKFVPEKCGERLTRDQELYQLTIIHALEAANGKNLCITQTDLDSLIRSKAAMFTILETIFSAVGITFDELAHFYVAGTFGCHINPESAIAIGMLPDLPREKFIAIGNSSLGGAIRLLRSREAFYEINSIRDRIMYMELNVNQEFMIRFNAAKFLPHTDPTRFPTVYIPNQV